MRIGHAESEKEIKKYGTKSLEFNNLLQHKANWPQAYLSSDEACTTHGYWKTLREWERKPDKQFVCGKLEKCIYRVVTYPWIDCILNELNPSFKCGHLQQTEISVDDVVKIHRRVSPFVVFVC